MKPKYLLTFLIGILTFQSLVAATGDTTQVRVWDTFHMNRYGNFDKWATLPAKNTKHERIWMRFTLGCLSNGQCEWDYTLRLFVRQRTGVVDSTLKQAPLFRVNGSAPDSIAYSTDTTWVTFFNTATKQNDSAIAERFTIVRYTNTVNPTQPTDTLYGFKANYWRFTYDTTGRKTDSVWVSSNTVITQQYTPYYEKFEKINDIELGRFISPYAVNFPKTFKYDYVYDITDYAGLIKDSAEFRIQYQGYSYGFTGTWDLIYIEGVPSREVISVTNVYNGGFNYGQSTSIEASLNEQSFTVPEGTNAVKARIIITGHGGESNENCAEFCPKMMYLKHNGTQIAQQLVWKDDCGANAIAAQPGTWVYNRANWCPGEKIRNFDYWLNAAAGSNNTIDLDMEPFVAAGPASYNIALQLIFYKEAKYEVDARIEDVLAPTTQFWHNRSNPICDNPKILLKNWGTAPLTSAWIHYKIGNAQAQGWQWTGQLKEHEETVVTLPDLILAGDLADSVFAVSIISINGQAVASRESAFNYEAKTVFRAPPTFPNSFVIETRTNQRPEQNNFTIRDNKGNIFFQRNFPTATTLYRDTINLPFGCFTFTFNDLGNNGLGWWAAPSEGNGTLRIVTLPPIRVLRTFNTDFGSFTQVNFRVQHAVGVNEKSMINSAIVIYPLPAQSYFTVEGIEWNAATLKDITGKTVRAYTQYTPTLSVTDIAEGIYFIELQTKQEGIVSRKIQVVH
ncbi:MAG: hypothetical protein MUE96_09795 [Bacteroidia bacterium]|jgi:hypothetical protein|nr:hypothetical protein [Bacteroidia bacterium]